MCSLFECSSRRRKVAECGGWGKVLGVMRRQLRWAGYGWIEFGVWNSVEPNTKVIVVESRQCARSVNLENDGVVRISQEGVRQGRAAMCVFEGEMRDARCERCLIC